MLPKVRWIGLLGFLLNESKEDSNSSNWIDLQHINPNITLHLHKVNIPLISQKQNLINHSN